MSYRHLALSVVAAMTLGACASAGGAGQSKSSGSPDKLSQSQIAESTANSAYDLVTTLRPGWLRPARSTSSGLYMNAGDIGVYVDGLRLGGPEALRTISAGTIESMEYLTATRAATAVRDLGSKATPVIMIRLKR